MIKDEHLKGATANTAGGLLEVSPERIIELQTKIMPASELKDRAADARAFFERWGDDLLTYLEVQQLKILSSEAENDAQILYLRGSIRGLQIIKEWFDKQVGIAKESEQEMQDKKDEESSGSIA